jgi:hypothetical protein
VQEIERSKQAVKLLKYLVLDGTRLGLKPFIVQLVPFPATDLFRDIVAGP